MIDSSAKQKLLLNQLISSSDIFAMCSPIIKASYFDPEFRNAIKFIQSYYDKYNAIPNPVLIHAETDLVLETVLITKDQIEYCCDETEKFCQEQAMVEAVLKSADLVEQKKDLGKIRGIIDDAYSVSLQKELGVNLFDNPEENLKETQESSPYPLGWTEFDDLLDGGLRRQEMLLLSANSGGGKSIVMANMGLDLARKHKLNVLYLSLELPIRMIRKRYAAMISGIAPREIQNRITEVATKITLEGQDCGSIMIDRLPAGTRPRDIRAYLKQFELKYGYIPDVLLVDYIDKMNCNENVSVDNVFEKDKLAAEQLHEIYVDYNMIGITASQQNRAAVTAFEHHHGHIAGGISKINETDIYISILMTDQMRAQGQIAFQFLKTRSSEGVGETIYMRWNRTALRVEPPEDVERSRLTFRGRISDTKSIIERAREATINKGGNKGNDISSAFNV